MDGECYVYIVPPGETEFATAGKLVLASDRRRNPIGRFVYGQSYLVRANAVAIDPIELKLTTETYGTRRLQGIFGAFRDSGPDYWGRRVIEKHSGKTELSELEYLLYSPEDRAGALSFGLSPSPLIPQRKFSRTLNLAELQRLADAVIADEELPTGPDIEQVEALLLAGTSMGGARPKAVIEDDDSLWIAKFNHPEDRWNHARVEHSMLMLARECGLSTVESRIVTAGGRDVLIVKRFDRIKAAGGYRRARLLSALTLLRATDSHVDRSRIPRNSSGGCVSMH